MKNVIVFDLDGVITSEECYWMTAGLVLHEMLYSPHYWNILGENVYYPARTREECVRLSHETLPEEIILQFKARSINSNWDTCYMAVSLAMIHLLAELPNLSALLPLRPADRDWIAAFRQALAEMKEPKRISQEIFRCFDASAFQGSVGLAILDQLNRYASEVLGQQITGVFARYSSSWKFCLDIFQEWYLGDILLYGKQYGHSPAQVGKPGCLQFEQPFLPLEQIRQTLETLRSQGYLLGIATGRPGQEAILPLKNYGLLEYFDPARIITDVEVNQAEAKFAEMTGETISLVKPHPYPFLAAANPNYQPNQPLPPQGSFIVVGDTPSDINGGRAAGAITIAVLTGARSPEARLLLEQSQPDFLIPNVTHFPSLLANLLL